MLLLHYAVFAPRDQEVPRGLGSCGSELQRPLKLNFHGDLALPAGLAQQIVRADRARCFSIQLRKLRACLKV